MCITGFICKCMETSTRSISAEGRVRSMKDGIHPRWYVPRKYKKKTNAERIQSMSIEELTEFIVGLNNHCLAGIGECDCSDEATKPCSQVRMRKTRDWLQSEVEE